MTDEDGSVASAGRHPTFLPDTDRANPEYLDDGSNLTNQEEVDRPYYSDDGASEYHESMSNTRGPHRRGVTEQSYLPDVGEDVDGSGYFERDPNAPTPDNHPEASTEVSTNKEPMVYLTRHEHHQRHNNTNGELSRANY